MLDRIQACLRRIVPGIIGVEHRSYGPRESLEFRQNVQGQQYPWRFQAANMSDGTLRSLGVLTALFHQIKAGDNVQIKAGDNAAPLVAIEEPEITIHPAAAGIVMDALIEASRTKQLLATTHSADLLDHEEIPSECILAVQNVGGETKITGVDSAARSAIKDLLYTPGELLRSGQLSPDPGANAKPASQSELFEPGR